MKYLLVVIMLLPSQEAKQLVIAEYETKEMCEQEKPRAQLTWQQMKLNQNVVFSCEPLE